MSTALKPTVVTHRAGEPEHRHGVEFSDHIFTVPLDYASHGGETIDVFARALTPDGGADFPWLVYFQGGPGSRADRPATISGWIKEALKDFRVLLLDQRGTGLSTPATQQTLPARGSVAQQVEYLSHFRADSIVADAESIRLTFNAEGLADGAWSTLGQSYGGFITLSYLSFFPEGVKEALVTAGVAALDGGADRVYQHTFARTAARNAEFYQLHPGAQERANQIAAHLARVEETLPTGERLTPERFQTLGSFLGGNTRIDALAYLLEDAFPLVDGHLPDTFLAQVQAVVSYAQNPLYALMHESIYGQGAATNWSAWRTSQQLPEFAPDAENLLFTGEAIMPWYFEQDPALAPLREVAEALAAKADWPALYDLDQLAKNTVPFAATAYLDDIYVDHDLAVETASRVRSLQLWETGEYHHDGLRADGEKIFATLLGMVRGQK